MADARSRSVELRYTDVSGREVTTTLAEAEGAKVVRGQPVRGFPTDLFQLKCRIFGV